MHNNCHEARGSSRIKKEGFGKDAAHTAFGVCNHDAVALSKGPFLHSDKKA